MAESQAIKISSTHYDPAAVVEKASPVIFLHAMLCSKEIWGDIPQVVANKTKRRVYTYDARNHGESTHTDQSNFDFNVVDLFTLMDKIKSEMVPKPDKFILVGHDLGGITAIKAALQKQEEFAKVIVMEMYAKKVPDSLVDRTKTFMKTWTECIQKISTATERAEVTRKSVENLYEKLSPDMKEIEEKESYMKGKFLYKEKDGHYEACYNPENLEKALDELKGDEKAYDGIYDGPAYFLYGTKSHFKIDDAVAEEARKKHFPNSELIAIPEASHFFVADIPDELAAKLSDLINGVSDKKTA